ncbi:hypothetical protein [Aeromicrobium sp. UC242_57]|uniref:hypothetical protein n=1 Tax=Aeromicrobium sp. UC242_57 TaxID=3374624 RepID=UPI0037A5B0C6
MLQSAPTTTQFRPASTVTGIQPLSDDSATTRGIWILGGILLGATLLIAVSPFAYTALRKRADHDLSRPVAQHALIPGR